ncbi:MAG: Asp23/Gls24 family envelope stress response protein [Lachnospirales bacterium]
MSVKLETNFGVISIETEVIAKVAGTAALECYGIVGMAAKSVRDDLIHLLKKESLTKGIKVDVLKNNALDITLHIIVEYGTSIPAIGDVVASTVKYKIEDSLGLIVNQVYICVDGVLNHNI